MRTVLRKLLTIACFLCIAGLVQGQAGSYNVTGYFFHPSSSRSLNLSKSITLVGPNTYLVDLGDLVNTFQFTFNIDASNHLVNWVPMQGTPPTGSGFMTADNPGNIVFSATPQQLGYTSNMYNNTYDPATKTFYMHYGYLSGGTGNNQNTYNRQVYEKWEYGGAKPIISAVVPPNVTEGTLLTIKGVNFTGTTFATLGTGIGPIPLGSLTVVSDSVITGIVGKGASGPVTVVNAIGSGQFQGVVYTAPAIPIFPWRYVGTQGFSTGSARSINIAAGPNNIPYVVFVDIQNGNKATVMKLVNGVWTAVGKPVSDGGCRLPNIVVDKANTPWVAYLDSLSGNNITVKHLTGSSWALVGPAGVGPNFNVGTNLVALAVDTTNKPHLLTIAANGQLNVIKFNSGAWANLGPGALGFKAGDAAITIDKTTNRVYVMGQESTTGQVAVQRFYGGVWENVGAQGFTTAANGIYYSDIKTDNLGNPFISMQEDDGNENVSVYAFKNGAWAPVGNKFFTNAHTYSSALALDTSGKPSVLFLDYSNYQQGTVMQPNPNNNGTWQTLGQRGFATANAFGSKPYIITGDNIKYIAYSDITRGGKVSVMQYFIPVPPVITSFLPTTGAQGDTITVKGQNFIGATASSFGGVAASKAIILSDSAALMVVGTGASGAVSITTPAGTATKTGFVYCRAVTPSVTIVASPSVLTICAGTPVKFTATAVNGGSTITYQWKKNNKNVGANSRIYNDTTLNNADSVWCVITGNAPCATSPTASSNVFKYKVNPVLHPAVTLTANPGTTICAGTPVVFTALGTSLGDSVTYQWRKNNKVVGTNKSTYADTVLKTGDSVLVIVKIYSPCATIVSITTSALKFKVNPVFNPSVAVTTNTGNIVCAGTRVTFTATPTNAGDTITYQWRKNNKKVGTASPVYLDTALKNNDSVWAIMTVQAACATANTITSSKVIITLNPNLKPTVTISSSPAAGICSGIPVTLTAVAANAGALPTYQWKKNNINVGTNSKQYIDDRLAQGDTVFVVVTAAAGTCAVPTTVTSNKLKFNVTPSVVPTVTVAVTPGTNICAPAKVTFTATATNGGSTIKYLWRKNGVATGLNKNTYVDSTLANDDKVTCTITGNATCRVSDTAISTPVVFTVATGAPAAPSAIVGKASVTAGQANVAYSVTAVAGVSYNWTVPAGVTITSGQGTNAIKVTWGSTNGAVTIQLTNACGLSPVFSKTVKITTGFAGNTSVTALLKTKPAADEVHPQLTALLYPNPATYEAHLQLSGYHGKVIVTITDMAGKTIKTKTLLQDAKMMGRQDYLLQLNNVSAGIYIVTVKDDVTVKSFKLVKAR